MMNIEVIAFDCDGVLFDTAAANRRYYDTVLSHMGKPPMTEDQFAYAHMHTVDEVIAFLFDDRAERQSAHAFRRKMGYDEFIAAMEPEPSLYTVLDDLRRHCRTAIATNRMDTMDRVLDLFDLRHLFDIVVTASDVERPKPSPEQLLKILAFFDISPDQALYVGDSTVDEAAAKQASIPFIAFDNPNLSADFHIRGLDEIPVILESSWRKSS